MDNVSGERGCLESPWIRHCIGILRIFSRILTETRNILNRNVKCVELFTHNVEYPEPSHVMPNVFLNHSHVTLHVLNLSYVISNVLASFETLDSNGADLVFPTI